MCAYSRQRSFKTVDDLSNTCLLLAALGVRLRLSVLFVCVFVVVCWKRVGECATAFVLIPWRCSHRIMQASTPPFACVTAADSASAKRLAIVRMQFLSEACLE